MPPRVAPAGARALCPFNNVTPSAPVPGRLPLRARGVELHLGPRPPTLPALQGPRHPAAPRLVSLLFANGVGYLANGPSPCFWSRGWGRGARGSARRGAGRARRRDSKEGAAADAVDIIAESALLSRRCGHQRAFTLLHFPPAPPAPSWCLGRTAAGGGEKGWWRGAR